MLISVKVTTEADKEEITKEHDTRYSVSVKEKPERGLANKRALEIIKSIFPGKSLRIVHGHHSSGKIVEVGE